ncbi:MAG: hypothetical protein J0H43_09360, partial [Actinobacteria bacterium]|nr:hypothetical protein [Actinomycetota bacterium]
MALLLVRHEDGSAPSAASSAPAPSARSSARSSVPPAPLVQVDGLGHPLLGVRAGWELFGRGNGVVVRIEFAAGRITRTVVGSIDSSGPVAFLPTGDGGLVRPLDAVAGYSVSDGLPPVGLAGLLGQGGAAFPGPDLGHVWVEASPGHLALVTGDGTRDGPQIALPAGASAQGGEADQRGGVLVFTARGSVDVTAHGATPVTSGNVVGVGPRTWLLRSCRTCPLTAVDRDSGVRHTVPPRQSPRNELGLVSPDGRLAALTDVTDDGSPGALYLIDLSSGAVRTVAAHVATDGYGLDSVAWSPDG